jgi:8-oxo-dGTP pyrophosphatase MutT (NUDIX family)
MRLFQILHKIKQIHPDNLPGFEAQVKMSPPLRKKYNAEDILQYKPKESAVMVLCYEKEEECYIAFTQRHEYDGAHSGQISLPGGKKDKEDIDLKATAIRETLEEIGVVISREQIVSELTWLYVPPSNFIIYPFVSCLEEVPRFIKEEKEVKEILEIRVQDFLNNAHKKKYLYKNEKLGISFESPSYVINGNTIWGATAMILSELISIIEHDTTN